MLFRSLEVTIREARNRQVRRMLAKLGHKVRDLTRTRMGPLTLEGLAPGKFRPLTGREVRQLKELPKGNVRKGKPRLTSPTSSGPAPDEPE